MSAGYEEIKIDLEMGTRYLINENAYFLGGIFAANESVIKNGKKYWISPVRYNNGYINTEELEDHFYNVRKIASKLGKDTLMASTIKANNLDSGKFSRLLGFGTFFETKRHTNLEDMIPDLKKSLISSRKEVIQCFILGMFDGRGSIDRNSNSNSVRYIVLDCENEVVGSFLCEIVEKYGFSYNYNKARERLEGGKARKDQLRIPGSENFLEKVGLISKKKFDVAASSYMSQKNYQVVYKNEILHGLKLLEGK